MTRPARADPHLPQDTAPDRRQAHRGIDGGGTRAAGADADKPHAPLRTWTSAIRPSRSCSILLSAGVRDALPRCQGSLWHASAAREGRHGQSSLRHLVRRRATIIDISDPTSPEERGYFIPKPGDGVAAPLTNDVFKDDRGLLCDRQRARPRRHRI